MVPIGRREAKHVPGGITKAVRRPAQGLTIGPSFRRLK
jgi:hypothetical protein